MASEVEICNLALSNIRAGSINSLNESSLQAQLCKLKYSILRDRCLKEIVWSFNRSIRPLAAVTTEIFNWSYVYAYPVDCLKIRRLIGEYEELPVGGSDVISRSLDERVRPPNRQQVPYEVFAASGGRVIAANMPNLRVDMAIKITDPNLFDDDFILALSHLLAAEIAVPIVGSELGDQLRVRELQLYESYMANSVVDDLNDSYLEPVESEFVTVRR